MNEKNYYPDVPILFTGNEKRMLEDLINHSPTNCTTKECSRTDFTNVLKKFNPKILVICLADESWETLRGFQILKDSPKYIHVPVIIIGKQEDCNFFKKMIDVEYLEIFTRPFDASGFIRSLEKYIELSEKKEEVLEKTMEMGNPISVPEKKIENKINKVSKQNEPQSILVVDDDIRMLNVIKLYLQDLYNITVVPSGKLALKFLSKKSADLVLLDYMMPEMDGPEVLKEIRENSSNPNVPVLFLTGVSDKELVMKGLEYRPNGYLLKPATREVLLERVTEILLDL